MHLGIDLEAILKMLEQSNSSQFGRKFLFTTIDEFEKLAMKGLLGDSSKILVKPMLQVWGKMADGRNKLSGILLVTGLFKSNLVIVGYNVDTFDDISIEYEKQKFSELIELSFVDTLSANNIANEVIIFDIHVEE